MTFKFHYLHKIILILSVFLYFNSYASNLKINGLSKLKVNDLQALTNIDLNKSIFTESDVNKIIFDIYNSDLIYNVILVNDDNLFTLNIEENKLIHNIFINGNLRIEDQLILESIFTKKNLFIDKANINKDINLIKNIYKSKGFNNLNISVSTEKFSDDRVNIIYEISEGEQSKIKTIKFIGNSSYSDRYLSSIINSKSLKFYNLFTSGSNLNIDTFSFDTNKIKAFYKDKGFFNVKVNYDISGTLSNSYILTFFIDEGERIKIEDFFLNQENLQFKKTINNYQDKFIKTLNKNKNFYDKALIDDFLLNLNNLLINNNNYNIIFQSSIKNLDGLYYLYLDQKNVIPEVINSISITGNNITKDKTVRSKLNFQPGDYFNQNAIDISKKNLLSFKYINNLDILKTTKDGKSDIVVNIDENKKTGQIMAAGTFSGDVGAGIDFGVKDNNLLGTGNTLDTNIMLNEENTLYKISINQYPIASSKISNKYSIFNTEKDLTNSFGFKSKDQGASYFLNFEYNEKVDISTGLSYKKSDRNSPSKSTISINDNIGDFDIYTIDLSLIYDTTNDFLYPTNGAKNSLYIEYSPKEISDDSFYKLLLRSDLYYELKNSNRFVFISNDVGFAESPDSKLKTTNAFSLGGLNFKGFDYRGIGPKVDDTYLGGNKFFTSTVGFGGSFLFDDKDNISTKLFYTLGSVWDSDYTSQNDLDLRSSAGISFDILTAIGPISFSYSIPIEKKVNDRTREFNFTIGTSF